MIMAGVDLVTGTPGRIEDMVNTEKLDLSQVSVMAERVYIVTHAS